MGPPALHTRVSNCGEPPPPPTEPPESRGGAACLRCHSSELRPVSVTAETAPSCASAVNAGVVAKVKRAPSALHRLVTICGEHPANVTKPDESPATEPRRLIDGRHLRVRLCSLLFAEQRVRRPSASSGALRERSVAGARERMATCARVAGSFEPKARRGDDMASVRSATRYTVSVSSRCRGDSVTRGARTGRVRAKRSLLRKLERAYLPDSGRTG
jgi:hypothetical protein